MGLIVRGTKSGTGTTAFGSGTTILASEVNTDLNTAYTLLNGNIENANIKDGAAISSSKINLSTITQNVAITGNLTVSGTAPTLPAGVIVDFAGNTAPDGGWLTCAGQAVSRETYAALFTAIGVLHGEGDSSTTFNLPNCQGRVLVGRDASDSSFNVIGETGGEKTHLLTGAESGIQAHNVTFAGIGGSGGATKLQTSDGTAGLSQTASVSAADALSAHNILQPYIVSLKIIKY